MSRSSRNLAMAAAALVTLGSMALASNEASARGFHGGGGGFRAGGVHGGFHGGFRGHVGHGVRIGFHRRPHLFPRWPHRHVGWHPHWRPRVIIGAAPVTYAAYSAPTYNRCTCLTKEYTPEGAVLFKDLCTQESAINPPPAPAAAAEQIAPTVQGSLQVPAQPAQFAR